MGVVIAKRAFCKALPIAFAAGAALSACSFEPPLHLPKVPANSGYTAGSLPQKTVGVTDKSSAGQAFLYGQDLGGDWWTFFHSSRLDALVAQALRNSPTIAAAQAQLRQAQANMAVNASIFYPQVTGNLGASRNKSSGASFGGRVPGTTYSLFTGSVGITYYPDIFGVNRLVYQGSKAQMEYQHYELEASRLALSGNVVNTAIGQASVESQIAATDAIINQEKALLELTKAQYQGGGVPYLNVLTQRSQVLDSETTLPPLQQQLAVYRHQMAILAGAFPSQWHERPFKLSEITLPRQIPVALPSTLVEHRPDIRAAEQQMRYALAQIGVAKAQFFPIVSLSASFGTSSLTPGLFFNPLSSVWGIAGALAQPLFEGGKLRAQEKVAYAAYDVTFADYRSTVLGAFGQVADALRALEHDGASVRTQSRARHTARQALALAEAGYRSGSTDYLSLLNAEVTYQNVRIALLRAETQRYQDATALFVALGGDDWRKADAASQQDSPSKGKQP